MLTVDLFKPRTGSRKEHDRSIQTVCRECTAGCGLWVFTQGNRIVDVQGDASHPVNRGRLCARASAFVGRLTHAERITRVLQRGGPEEAFAPLENWETALDLLADRLRQAKEQYGAECLAVSCHRHGGSDFALGARRFARLWGTPRVYPLPHGADHGAAKAAMASGRLPDAHWPGSGCFLLVEADLANSHPVLFGWILEAQRRGAKVCAVDSEFTPTLAKADMCRMIRPASGNWLGAALMKIMLEEKLCSSASSASRSTAAQAWQETFDRMPSEAALHATGITLDLLRPMARFLAGHGPVLVITGRKISALRYSSIWPTLVTAMGWSDSLQGGWHPLSSGIADLSTTKDIVGGESLSTKPTAFDSPGGLWEKTWEAPPDEAPRILIFSGNALNEPCFPFRQCIHEMDLAVYFGSRLNPAGRLAHMVFPAAEWPERDDLYLGENGILQWGRRMVVAADGARTGLDFWAGLARRFGWEAHFPWEVVNGRSDLRAFFDWALQQSPWMQGLQVEPLESAPRIMGIPDGSRAVPAGRMTPMPAPDEADCPGRPAGAERFPLLLTATLDSDNGDPDPALRRLTGGSGVLIHPHIGRALAIQTGDMVVVRNDRESWKARAWLTRTIPLRMVRSLCGSMPSQVLVHKVGEDPERSLAALKAMGL